VDATSSLYTRVIIDQVIVSDITLLYSPGQIALAALMWAQERNMAKNSTTSQPKVDWMGYIRLRFPAEHQQSSEWMEQTLHELTRMLSELDEQNNRLLLENDNIQVLKAIHKKLKKVRIWGKKTAKQKEKRAAEEDNRAAKRIKTEA
jgi:cyclin H